MKSRSQGVFTLAPNVHLYSNAAEVVPIPDLEDQAN